MGPGLCARAVALLAFAALLAPVAPAAGFFDGIPRKGYVRDDVAWDVVDVANGNAVVARVRYLRLVLDTGRRDIAYDHWPEREMLLVERATGERVVFERLAKLSDDDPSALRPSGRIAVSGASVETFARTSPVPGGDPCGAVDVVLHVGNVELPVSSQDLGLRTVRAGVAQVVDAAFGPRDKETMSGAVPILVAARSAGLPAAPLQLLDVFFPGQTFARAAEGLTFRPSGAAPLNPTDGPWRSVTDAPEITQGVPVH